MGKHRNDAGFSLVEVVLALAVVVFAGIALVSLLIEGLKSNGDSKQQIQAATIAEAICATRRAAPTQDLSTTQPTFPLPVLSTATSGVAGPYYLTRNGTLTTLSAGDARFGLMYQITPSADYVPPLVAGDPAVSPGVSVVYLCLYWPPAATSSKAVSSVQNLSYFQLSTTFSLP